MTIPDILSLAQWLIASLAVGGGLWKGLEAAANAIANALSKRAEALAMARRIELEEKRADWDKREQEYKRAISLIDQLQETIDRQDIKIENQTARIDALYNIIEEHKQRWEQQEMSYIERIKALESELSDVRDENAKLKERLRCLEGEYQNALRRIDRLEKGDTGPLREKE